jgi:poly(hydroxyalkanoate) granule-associated protein
MAKLKNKSEPKPQNLADKILARLPDESNLAAISQKIMNSAQQIWQAGLGAFGQAQEQGSKLFDALVKEGSSWEKATRKFTSAKVDEVREVVESTMSSVRERASDTLDRLERVFEDRVSRALGKLGIPGKKDLEELSKQVAALQKAVLELKKTDKPASLKASVEKAVKSAPEKARAVLDKAKQSAAAVKKAAEKAIKPA